MITALLILTQAERAHADRSESWKKPGTIVFSIEPIEYGKEDPTKFATELPVGAPLYGRAYLVPSRSKSVTITRYLDGKKFAETTGDIPKSDPTTIRISVSELYKGWGADNSPHKVRVVVRGDDGTELAAGECAVGIAAPEGSAEATCGAKLKGCIFEDAWEQCAPYWYDCLRSTDDFTRTCKAKKKATTAFATAKRKGYTLDMKCNGDMHVERPREAGGGAYDVKAVSSKRMTQMLECGMCQSNQQRCLKSALTRPAQQACDTELSKCRSKQRCDKPER